MGKRSRLEDETVQVDKQEKKKRKKERKKEKKAKKEKKGKKARKDEHEEEEEGGATMDELLRLNKSLEASVEEEIGPTQDVPSEQTSTDSHKLSVFVGNLPYNIDEDTMYETFKDCGIKGYDSITAVRFGVDEKGEFKRYAHVDFDSPEAARNALGLEGTTIMGKELRVQLAAGTKSQKQQQAQQQAASTFDKPDKPADNPNYVDRCCVKNLAYDITEEVLFEEFEKQGITAKHVLWINDRETGQFYGTSFVTFATCEDAAWAVACGETGKWMILGRPVKVELCPHRNDKRKNAQSSDAGPGKRTDVVRPPSARPEGGTTTCFFGNLPFEIDDDKLKRFCRDVAEVQTIRWILSEAGEFKGAGFADFANCETVDRVVKLKNGRKLMGRVIRVDYAPNTKTKHKLKASK